VNPAAQSIGVSFVPCRPKLTCGRVRPLIFERQDHALAELVVEPACFGRSPCLADSALLWANVASTVVSTCVKVTGKTIDMAMRRPARPRPRAVIS
jgi:hypothetical protein